MLMLPHLTELYQLTRIMQTSPVWNLSHAANEGTMQKIRCGDTRPASVIYNEVYKQLVQEAQSAQS